MASRMKEKQVTAQISNKGKFKERGIQWGDCYEGSERTFVDCFPRIYFPGIILIPLEEFIILPLLARCLVVGMTHFQLWDGSTKEYRYSKRQSRKRERNKDLGASLGATGLSLT